MNMKNNKLCIELISLILIIASISFTLCSCQSENRINIPDTISNTSASATTQESERLSASTSADNGEKNSDVSTSKESSVLLPRPSSSSDRLGIASIVDDIKDSVVAINITGTVNDYFWGSYSTEGSGSGVIISEDGYIVTNNHVIEDGDSISVFLNDGEKCNAVLIGSDSKTDLAVVKIDKKGLKPVSFGISSTLRVGDYAIAVGNPTGELQGSVTMGIISALNRQVVVDGIEMTMLQTDAAVSPGNSGGGLFDSNGTLIGIVTAKSKENNVEGLGFVIPIDCAYPIICDLAKYGYVTGRPSLGFETVDITNRSAMIRNGLSWMGVYINKVYEGSTAESTGLKFKDYIKSVDGEELTSGDRLIEILKTKKVGDTLVLEVWRDDDIFDIVLKIDEDKYTN